MPNNITLDKRALERIGAAVSLGDVSAIPWRERDEFAAQAREALRMETLLDTLAEVVAHIPDFYDMPLEE